VDPHVVDLERAVRGVGLPDRPPRAPQLSGQPTRAVSAQRPEGAHVHARAADGDQDPLVDQDRERLAGGGAGDPVPLHQVVLAGDPVAVGGPPGGDGGPQLLGDLAVYRRGLVIGRRHGCHPLARTAWRRGSRWGVGWGSVLVFIPLLPPVPRPPPAGAPGGAARCARARRRPRSGTRPGPAGVGWWSGRARRPDRPR